MAAIKALIKPELLTWTRNRAKITVADAAKAADVEVESIEAWEIGKDSPTISQLRNLAAKYRFPLAVFDLPAPPADFAPLRDYRRLPDADDRRISANLAYHIRNAYERRELALELHNDLGEPVRAFRLKASTSDSPETVGERVRQFLGVTDDAQKKAARQLRSFDSGGATSKKMTFLPLSSAARNHSVELKEMRGFAIAKAEIPVVVINGKDYSQGGKCYTLLHELAHVMLGESAITNGELGGTAEEQKIERFCDAVSAAALMPRDLMLSFPQVRPGRRT